MKRWLDRTTGLVPMYKLVLIFLLAISVLAIILSFAGQLSYAPDALLASLAVSLGVTFGTSWLAARIVTTRFHFESALISGFLIFLIINPRLELESLLGTALAAVIASASKYLVAVRGRHIFNPAALGLFIVGMIGLAYPGWWVGTPYLQPLIVIGALLVLYRTQRLTMGVVFIALAGAINVVAFLVGGSTLETALAFTFLSSPLVFFAGFMLSEPLTLPPLRWQRLAEAGLVALLFTVPFSIGLVTSTPQFALLVGNLLAFFAGQRRGIRLTYLGKQQLGPGTWELAFRPARPVRFRPGQFMELTIPHRRADFRGSRRYFSIASAPSAELITFALTVPTKSSSFKKALLDLEPGATVTGTGVGGDFALPKDVSEPLLLVAGGIGITPFASQLAHAVERGDKRDVVVVYATSAAGELPYRELLERSGARVVLYGPEPADLPAGWVYGGEGRVTGERLASAVPDAAKRRAYVSGPPALVNDLRRALRAQGAKRVHSDYFSGY